MSFFVITLVLKAAKQPLTTVLKPNDRYLLSEKKFRLYYTSRSTNEAQTIDLYFENNWQDVRQLSFGFNNRNDGAEKTAASRTAEDDKAYKTYLLYE